jgi:hypothetical protein
VDNQSIISCDFRRINNIDIVYAIKEDDEINVEYLPYCIWFPRTCIIADYRELYGEFDVLPEINLMAEALYAGNNIFSHFFGDIPLYPSGVSKTIYSVMDDIHAKIDEARQISYNFGRTCVYGLLESVFWYTVKVMITTF